MATIYKTRYTLVTEEEGLIRIRGRSGTLLFILSVLAVIGTAALVLSSMKFTPDGALERLCRWASIILLPLSVLLALIALGQSVGSRVTFDCSAGRVIKGSRGYDFGEVSDIGAERLPFGETNLYFLTLTVGGESLRIASDTDIRNLESISAYLKGELGSGESSSRAEKVDEKAFFAPRFAGVFLLSLGCLRSATGYFLLPGLIFTAPGSSHGPLVWPLGIWIAIAGILFLSGIPAVSRIKKTSAWMKALGLLAYLSIYFFVCWR